eukprot:scaffold61698_cov69-Phaeocystis_antarctica.AAC.2
MRRCRSRPSRYNTAPPKQTDRQTDSLVERHTALLRDSSTTLQTQRLTSEEAPPKRHRAPDSGNTIEHQRREA